MSLVVFIQFYITNSQNELNPTLTHKGKDKKNLVIQEVILKTQGILL